MPKKIKKEKELKFKNSEKKFINVNNVHYYFIALFIILVCICVGVGVYRYLEDSYHVNSSNAVERLIYSEKVDEGYNVYYVIRNDKGEVYATFSTPNNSDEKKWGEDKFLDYNEEIYDMQIFMNTYGELLDFNIEEYNEYKDEDFKCATIEERIEDLHEAFKDNNVKAIITVIGGYNVNQILEYIDYKLIQENPKIICGFSDNTALVNAIHAKTNMVTYLGVQFFSFGMKYGFEYSMEYFKKMFFENEKIEVLSSKKWSNDKWLKNQEDRKFIDNEGMKVINKGEAEGKIIGGNLCTLNLLQGTEYMPDLDNSVLFIEDDGETGKAFIKEFDRNLQSLLHCAKRKRIKVLVIGRAEQISEMNYDKWKKIIETKS